MSSVQLMCPLPPPPSVKLLNRGINRQSSKAARVAPNPWKDLLTTSNQLPGNTVICLARFFGTLG
ncbi:hypothetical protein LZ30DRAFT_706709 [Colletotrichum cereale]|nr:hypothetical protein LZ30DRAFT_706709 [Colletotrichum cereale]